jgi:hypothetical protein
METNLFRFGLNSRDSFLMETKFLLGVYLVRRRDSMLMETKFLLFDVNVETKVVIKEVEVALLVVIILLLVAAATCDLSRDDRYKPGPNNISEELR